MAESADALDSGSNGGNSVQVQVLLPAPEKSINLDTRLVLFSTKSVLRRNKSATQMKSLRDEIRLRRYNKDGFNFIRAMRGFHPNLFGFHREQSERFHYCIIFSVVLKVTVSAKTEAHLSVCLGFARLADVSVIKRKRLLQESK